MKKNMYSVLLHFFLFVCLVIPLHTTANAANTTDDCLQILTSDFNSNSAQEFIGTQHLNITDSQYQPIRTLNRKIQFHKRQDHCHLSVGQRHQPESFCRRICPCRSGRK